VVLFVVVESHAHQARDIEDAVGGMGPRAEPAGVVEAVDLGHGRPSSGLEGRQQLIEGSLVGRDAEARLRECPSWASGLGELVEAALPDLRLDDDQMKDLLSRGPLVVDDRMSPSRSGSLGQPVVCRE